MQTLIAAVDAVINDLRAIQRPEDACRAVLGGAPVATNVWLNIHGAHLDSSLGTLKAELARYRVELPH